MPIPVSLFIITKFLQKEKGEVYLGSKKITDQQLQALVYQSNDLNIPATDRTYSCSNYNLNHSHTNALLTLQGSAEDEIVDWRVVSVEKITDIAVVNEKLQQFFNTARDFYLQNCQCKNNTNIMTWNDYIDEPEPLYDIIPVSLETVMNGSNSKFHAYNGLYTENRLFTVTARILSLDSSDPHGDTFIIGDDQNNDMSIIFNPSYVIKPSTGMTIRAFFTYNYVPTIVGYVIIDDNGAFEASKKHVDEFNVNKKTSDEFMTVCFLPQ